VTPIEPMQPSEAVTDSNGDVFDPELHASKPNGEPAVKVDGTFRKKRRDAGGRRASVTSSSTRTKSTAPAGMPRALAEQRTRHIKGVKNAAAGLLMPLSFVSPVDAFTLSDLVDPFAEAVADYAPENDKVSVALDKLSAGGGLFTVLSLIGLGVVQVMHNHGQIPENIARMVGAKPVSETHKIMAQRQEAMEREAVARAAQDAADARAAAEWAAEQGAERG
jgi:hypothetical protein